MPIQAQAEQAPWVQLAASYLKAIQEALSKHATPAAVQDMHFNLLGLNSPPLAAIDFKSFHKFD